MAELVSIVLRTRCRPNKNDKQSVQAIARGLRNISVYRRADVVRNSVVFYVLMLLNVSFGHVSARYSLILLIGQCLGADFYR